MNERFSEILENEILPRVRQPSRYLGTELNSVHKDPAEVDLRLCLAFPDSCDVGLGNLGLQILYHILNRQPGIWAERAYTPDQDMDDELQRRGLRFFSLESRTPLSEFDAVGFTLQWELTYTNILHMLERGGIPAMARDRTDAHPVVLAGGPCAFNPEPLADFIDAFVVGDGEEVVLEVAEALREGKRRGRDWRLERLARIGGVYVPALYATRTAPDTGVVIPELSKPIVKRVAADLAVPDYSASTIVPFAKQVHDRVSIEILRGCTRGCRFCQAGMVTRPVRERSVDDIDRCVERVIRTTGYEEVSLASLSTCDHSRIRELVRRSVARAIPEGVTVGLPSLRLDSFSVEMADWVSIMGKSGLTFAPEAATDRMRAVINKFIPDDELLAIARDAYARGWEHVKLYFMIGLPGEQDEDVQAIADLANRVLSAGKAIRRSSRVNLSISTFVPRPHTPLQWERQISMEETEAKQRLLARHLRPGVKFGRHDARQSFLEGVLARCDRRAGRLLLEAHRLGCRFDGWTERLNWDAWQEAFSRWGMKPDEQIRARSLEETLPWDHIDTLVSKDWLKEDCLRARRSEWQSDCRSGRCNRCGVMESQRGLCQGMLERGRTEVRQESEPAVGTLQRPPEPQPAAKIRLRFARRGPVRFLSHLEMVSVFLRAIRRARIPVSYSQGFSPSPRVAFSCALPVGFETEGDYLDMLLRESVSAPDVQRRLNQALPAGFEALNSAEVPVQAPALMSAVVAERYLATLVGVEKAVIEAASGAAQSFGSREALWVEKTNKKGKVRQENILPSIRELAVRRADEAGLSLELLLVQQEGVKAGAREVLAAICPEIDWARWRVRKLESYVSTDTGLADPLSAYRDASSQAQGNA